jgi:hypothetical protein
MNSTPEDSDIKNHIQILQQYARKCDHITEMGVRGLNSTKVFLESKPKKLISYDWDKPPFQVDRLILRQAQELALRDQIDFQFLVADTTSIEINPTDLLYIDTWHTYEQLLLELLLHSSNVKKYIIAHDTNELVFPGMTCAIEDFLNINQHWQMHFMLVDLPGITVLERIEDKTTLCGDFAEDELRSEIEKQINLYYEECQSATGPTSSKWMDYKNQQLQRFLNDSRWPKTNALRK